MFFIGLDIGQMQDYTAISVIEKKPNEQGKDEKGKSIYDLRLLERQPLGTSYPDIIKRVKELMTNEQLKGKVRLIIDNTGVGRPVFDMLIRESCYPCGITITGGNQVTVPTHSEYHVPKRDIVSTLNILFQCGRLKIAKDLTSGDVFIRELMNFKVKINIKTAHDTYETWREGSHDDLVLSVGLALWFAENKHCEPRIRFI